ncbi:hypothetical protein [Aeromonas phage Asp37]|nr:hypothetical protein [Aeromonas phage Asp37]
MKKKRKTLIQILDRMWSRVTGRRHQFRVVLGYKRKGQQRPAEVTMYRCFDMSWVPGHDDFYRTIRTHFGPDIIKAAKEAYGSLNNGTITLESIVYLGRF